MIDLHIHTNHSDGTASVKEILQKAEELGLTYISITDHESCRAYEELETINVKKYYQGNIIPGVELKAYYHGKIIDILGYQMDTKKMQHWLDDFYQGKGHAQMQTKYLTKYYDACKNMGLSIVPFDEIQWDSEHDWASPIIYREIKKQQSNKDRLSEEVWNQFNAFKYQYCYNKESEFYVDKSEDYPSINQVLDAIHEAGGKAFVAHVYMYQWVKEKERFIKELLDNYDFDGMECFYSQFTKEQIQYVLEECKKRKLYCSGGCDYHGKNTPEIELGIGKGSFSIPDELIKNWISKKEEEVCI